MTDLHGWASELWDMGYRGLPCPECDALVHADYLERWQRSQPQWRRLIYAATGRALLPPDQEYREWREALSK